MTGPRDSILKAIVFMIASAFSFALMGAFVKFSGDIPLLQKVFFRNLISVFIAFFMVYKNSKKGKLQLIKDPGNLPKLILRSVFGLTGVVFYFYAINNMNLADSSMLNKLSPFFVALFASFFLKEKLKRSTMFSMFAAFISALLIIKPQFDLTVIPALSGALSGALAGGAYTILRSLKDKEHPSSIVLFFSLFSVAVLIVPVTIIFKVPDLFQLFSLVMIGVCAAFGQLGLTYAYRYAPASQISIFNYTSILFAGIIGFVLWAEVPDVYSMIGGVGVILSGVVVFLSNSGKLRLFDRLK